MIRSASRPRRGVATLMALLAIMITLGVCYTMLRVHTTSRLLQHNADRLAEVRRAANSGLHAALSAMHTPSWAGADTSHVVSISSDTWYEVEYLTGDAALPAGDSRYAYRVTIRSTGYGSRPTGPNLKAVATAVVQLTPRAIASEPAGWGGIQGATVLHWDDTSPLKLELPNSLRGTIRSHGPVEVAATTPPDSNRPFQGRIDEVAVFSSALSAANIAVVHASSLAGNLPTAYTNLTPDSWWRFNETAGTPTAANQGFGNEGLYYGPTLEQTGCPGEAGNLAPQFDGHNDQVLLGDEGATSDLTVFAWVNDDGPGDTAESYIVARGAGAANGLQAWSLSLDDISGARRPRFRLRTSGGTTTLEAASVTITPGAWHFLAATYDQSTMRLYHNGLEVANIGQTGPINHPAQSVAMVGDRPPGNCRGAYLRGQDDGFNDHRTLVGTVETPLANLGSEDEDLIRGSLGAAVSDLTGPAQEPAAFPSLPASYQLYPGGKTYSAGSIGAFSSSTQILPDPVSNPLGLVTATGDVELGSNVTFRGVLLAEAGSLTLDGSNITIEPASLPPLEGAGSQLELPVVIVEDGLTIQDPTAATVDGMVLSWGDARLEAGAGSAVSLRGVLAAPRVEMAPRTNWPVTAAWWEPKLAQWVYEESMGISFEPLPFFLDSNHSLAPAPEWLIEPPLQPTNYHWHDWLGPLFVPAGGDLHLRWEVVRWQES